MKVIDYAFLSEEEQKKEKGIILEDRDIIHVVIDKFPKTEVVLKAEQQIIKIMDKELYASKKKEE